MYKIIADKRIKTSEGMKKKGDTLNAKLLCEKQAESFLKKKIIAKLSEAEVKVIEEKKLAAEKKAEADKKKADAAAKKKQQNN